jgi:simple sugar transport system substrate-binding protein
MVEFSPETVVSGQIVHWETIYIDIIEKVLDGTYTSENLEDVDYFWLLEQGAVELGAAPGVPIAEDFIPELQEVEVDHPEFGTISVYDLTLERLAQMSEGREVFEPFAGPMVDRNGNEVYAEGYVPTIEDLVGMEWAAPGVMGAWDNEPR